MSVPVSVHFVYWLCHVLVRYYRSWVRTRVMIQEISVLMLFCYVLHIYFTQCQHYYCFYVSASYLEGHTRTGAGEGITGVSVISL